MPEEISDRMGGLLAWVLGRLVKNFETIFVAQQNAIPLLERALLLRNEPGVAVHNMYPRFVVLFRRCRGLPAEYEKKGVSICKSKKAFFPDRFGDSFRPVFGFP